MSYALRGWVEFTSELAYEMNDQCIERFIDGLDQSRAMRLSMQPMGSGGQGVSAMVEGQAEKVQYIRYASPAAMVDISLLYLRDLAEDGFSQPPRGWARLVALRSELVADACCKPRQRALRVRLTPPPPEPHRPAHRDRTRPLLGRSGGRVCGHRADMGLTTRTEAASG